MRTLDQLKEETVGLLEKTLIVPEDICDIVDAFMDVLESHGGTIRFNAPVNGPARKVPVNTAGERSRVGR